MGPASERVWGRCAADPAPGAGLVVRGTGVAAAGAGLLIIGPPGSGKSALAAAMIALGAELVGDDAVTIRPGVMPKMTPPPGGTGLIEIRGLGLVPAPTCGGAPLHALVDMAEAETERLPPPRTRAAWGAVLPLFHVSASPAFAAGLVLYLRSGCRITR